MSELPTFGLCVLLLNFAGDFLVNLQYFLHHFRIVVFHLVNYFLIAMNLVIHFRQFAHNLFCCGFFALFLHEDNFCFLLVTVTLFVLATVALFDLVSVRFFVMLTQHSSSSKPRVASLASRAS